MKAVIHTMPVLIRNQDDLSMLITCLESLAKSEEHPMVILYNQGNLTNADLTNVIEPYIKKYHIIGAGKNDGIPFARQACFEYVWAHYPECIYLTEIHPDMIFSPHWTDPLQEFLETHPNEPCVCPGILTASGEWHPYKKGIPITAIPKSMDQLLTVLDEHKTAKVVEGFVHPVMHRSSDLKKIGGYQLSDLPGMQGYEDDYLLLSYFHILRLPATWKPKAYLQSCVFHYTMAQRMSLPNIEQEANKNLEGIIRRFGTQGLQDLKHIHETRMAEETTSLKLVLLESQPETKSTGISRLSNSPVINVTTRKEIVKENGITYAPHTVIEEIYPKDYAAIVSHPYWVNIIGRLNPNVVISMIPDSLVHQKDPNIDFYLKALCLKSNLIITESEETFINLSLKYPLVFCCIDPPYSQPIFDSKLSTFSEKDGLILEVLHEIKYEGTEGILKIHQMAVNWRKERINDLKESLEWAPHHEENLFLLARYLYLNEDWAEAEHYFFQAFSRNIVFNVNSGLKKYYPWITLVQARQGKIKDALNSYGILALTQSQKDLYYKLLSLYAEQQHHFIQAELCRENGDIRYAAYLYENLPETLTYEDKYQLYKDCMNHDQALYYLSCLQSEPKIEMEKWMIQGEKEELSGDKYRAIHCYLQAACYDEQVLSRILRIKTVDEFLGEKGQ
ncbi:hypothetical protein HPT25_19225 [Bacillus sp. BRMEA1]|uniref:tetratricopeptide repeat protein n=1 Tax=Neobacillus endophyticus TaxID=2738405 RepID=UPI001562EC27|nr:hypothetical protein [Neobacillus endophyticus]NRD79497.1 hypothetical protein [Neobacillus endophyticus]